MESIRSIHNAFLLAPDGTEVFMDEKYGFHDMHELTAMSLFPTSSTPLDDAMRAGYIKMNCSIKHKHLTFNEPTQAQLDWLFDNHMLHDLYIYENDNWESWN